MREREETPSLCSSVAAPRGMGGMQLGRREKVRLLVYYSCACAGEAAELGLQWNLAALNLADLRCCGRTMGRGPRTGRRVIRGVARGRVQRR